jgi:hypothetical protein
MIHGRARHAQTDRGKLGNNRLRFRKGFALASAARRLRRLPSRSAGDYVVGAKNQTLTLRPGELSSNSIRAP